MVVPVIHDVFTITHQVSINYITLNPVVRVGLREDEVSVIPGSLIKVVNYSTLIKVVKIAHPIPHVLNKDPFYRGRST